ncbi:BspA family leucine-rich repeat surface protein, partial [Flavobacteriaceae bacterium]|nr:BspA family leucine-rich repeat surface protein [Flavobacteriaceae bacterium]
YEMDSMFQGTEAVDIDISNWDVSSVDNMKNMFFKSQFNGDISNWDVSNVRYMTGMFSESQFNGDISKWDVSNVRDMSFMFNRAEFNGDVSNWDVSKVRYMWRMFAGLTFNGDTSKWDVSNDTDTTEMFLKIDYLEEERRAKESKRRSDGGRIGGSGICGCLKSKNSPSSSCKTIFKNRYGTSNPSSDQMRVDYLNCS